MSQGTRRSSEPGIALGALLLIAAAAIASGCDRRIGDLAGDAVDSGSETAADAAGGSDPLGDAAVESPPDAAPDARPPDARPPCEEGDARVEDPATGACYMLFQESLSWDQAQAACAQLGGHLATATSQLENSLASQIVPASDDIWLGASDTGSEGDFAWVTLEPFAFTHWRRGEPNDGGDDGEDCAILEGDNNLPGLGCLWDDRPCEDGHPYLCERP